MKRIINSLGVFAFLALAQAAMADGGVVSLGFNLPSFADIIGFLIKFLFFFAGLAALFYLLLGALSWVKSSGDKEAVKKAQDKIQAAVVGLVILVVVLVLIATMENVILPGTFSVGLTRPLIIPALIK